MANPRQRKKLRSGSHKPVHHSRRAKTLLKKQPPIRGPKVLQDAWDKQKTVRQNYEALGLVATLNPTPSGGVERTWSASDGRETPADASTSSKGSSSQKAPKPSTDILAKGYGRIIRDEKGNIVDVQLADDGEAEVTPMEDVLGDILDPSRDEELAPWVGLGSNAAAGQNHAPSTHVVQALEDLSKGHGDALVRFASTGELAVLRRLVDKYGQDVEAMARDCKLNSDQRTTGELSRAIKKAGGFAELTKGC